MQNIFANYELIKLGTTNVHWTNFLVIAVVFIACAFTLRKGGNTQLLDKNQTDQLKGIAILLVIIGHFWIHVSTERCNLIFDESVALFFLLSGFGLTASKGSRGIGFRRYVVQRIKRVMAPYWVATAIILFLDFLILNRVYPIGDILLTTLGINVTPSTKHLDYARWYITLLLFWYAVFPVIIYFLRVKRGLLYVAIFSTATILVDYYIVHFDWYQILAFPFGCILGIYYETAKRLFINHARYWFYLSILSLVFLCAYKITLDPYVITLFPSLVVRFVDEIESILFSGAFILIVASIGYRGYYSRLLLFAGSISYELFLLHGIFLIKYNPVISGNTAFALIPQFILFLSLIMIIAFLFQKSVKVISEPLNYLDNAKAYTYDNKS